MNEFYLLAIQKSIVNNLKREFDLPPTLIYILSAIHYCSTRNKSIIASSSDLVALLPSITQSKFYKGLRTLCDQQYIELVNKRGKGKKSANYSMTGKGNLVIEAYSEQLHKIKSQHPSYLVK